MSVAVVVVSYEVRERLLRCLASVRACIRRTQELCAGAQVDLVVVDNASTDGTAFALRQQFPEVTVVAMPTNVGFGQAVNEGVRRVPGRLILILNPDTELAEDTIYRMARRLEADPRVGVLGARQVNDSGVFQLSVGPAPSLAAELGRKAIQMLLDRGVGWATKAVDAALQRRCDVDWVAASCMLLRRETFDAVGGFDPRFFLYFEDIDLCLRIRAQGLRVIYDPTVTIRHQRGESAATNRSRAMQAYRESQEIFWRTHGRGVSRHVAASYARLRGRYWTGA